MSIQPSGFHPGPLSDPNLAFEVEFALQLLETLDTPVSLGVALRIQDRQWNNIAALEVDPRNYHDVAHFADDYLAAGLLKKSPSLPLTGEDGLPLDLEVAAVQSFRDCESRCKETNDRLYSGLLPSWWREFQLAFARNLGPLTGDTVGVKPLDRILALCKHGPGATTGVKGRGSVQSLKFDAQIDLTDDLIPYVRSLMGERWWDHNREFRVVLGNRFFSVPKNALARRGACTEPTLNLWFQLGIGGFLEQRLAYLGWPITDQTRNQELARRAYACRLATLDMKSSSDLIAHSVIVLGAPLEWVELLSVARSSHTFIDGEWLEVEKFSSMGNGFTFPLQSLLFLSVVQTVVPPEEWLDVGVYGDDIIVPQQYAEEVIARLEALGLLVNTKKSHLAGEFFESCGTDWFKGEPVRPFFLRKDPAKESVPYQVQTANALRFYALRRSRVHGWCDSRFQLLWRDLYDSAPRVWRSCTVPPVFGDTGFVVSERESISLLDYKNPKRLWCETRAFRYMTPTPDLYDGGTLGVLFSALAALPSQSMDISPRGDIVLTVRDRVERGDIPRRTRDGYDLWGRLVANMDVLDWLSEYTDQSAGFRFVRSPSLGREPRRGLMGKAIPRTGHAMWPEGFDWL